jgi:hypothetical protein
MGRRDFACGIVAIFGLLTLLGGCAAMSLNQLTESRNSVETQVFLKPAFINRQQGRLVIYPFTHPLYAPGTGHRVTHEFYQELLRSDLYREIVLSKQMSIESEQTLVSTDLRNFDVAMRGKIVHLLAGSANTPSQLAVEIQIMNVSTGVLIWFVRLEGTSEVGESIDLVWHTFPGQSARPYQSIARALAQQLVRVMTPPPESQTPVSAPRNPVSEAMPDN